VVSELQEFQVECAYYYFHIGNKTARTLADLFRSIAYQMAMTNATIRNRLVDLCREGAMFDLEDDLAIWTKLFRKCILQVRTSSSPANVMHSYLCCRPESIRHSTGSSMPLMNAADIKSFLPC
jgi:hypothetical protein